MPTTTNDWLLAYLSSLQRDELFGSAQATPPLPLVQVPPMRNDAGAPITIHEAATLPRIVLAGAAGSGKTTTLRQLAADTAQACLAALRRGGAYEHIPPAPIYLDLARFAGTLEATLAEQIGIAVPTLLELSERCDLLLLLDGLDRIPAGIQLASLAAIQRGLHALGQHVRWVTTCRTEALDLFQFWVGSAPIFAIGALTNQQVIETISYSVGPQAASWLETQPELLDLACRPRWLAALTRSGKLEQLPIARGFLMLTLLRSVLEETSPSKPLAAAALAALAELALAMERTDRDQLTPTEAIQALRAANDANVLIRVLVAAGVLVEGADQALQFAKPLLRSTARAAGLVRMSPDQWDTRTLSQPWREALVLAYGLHSDPATVLAWMIQHEAADAISRALAENMRPEQFEAALAQGGIISSALRIRLADAFRTIGAHQAAISQLQLADEQGYAETDLYRRLGDLYANESQWQQARVAYIQVLAHEPHDLQYRQRLGVVCSRLGAADEAEVALQDVIAAVQELRGTAAAELGQLYARQARYELALSYYQQAVAAQPGTPDYHRGMATNLHHLGRSAAAEDLLRDLLAAHTDDALAHAELGRIYAATSRLALAQESLARAATLRPHDPEIATTLGQIRMQCGDAAGARAAFQLAAQYANTDAALQIALGQACQVAGDLPVALQAYRQAIRLEPQHIQGLRLLGTLLGELGLYEEGTTVLQQALALRSGSADLLAALGELLRQKGEIAAALALYRQALAAEPNTPDYAVGVGLLLLDSGQHAEAVRHLAHAIDLAPERADLHAAIARYAADRQQWAAAAESFLHAAHHAPNEPSYPREAAICLIEAGNREKGRSLLAQAIRRDRKNEATWLAVSHMHAGAGRLAHAIRSLRRAGHSSDALELLGRCLHQVGRTEEAIAAFGQALLAGAPGPQTLEYYSRTLAAGGQIARAYEVAQRAIHLGGGHPSLLQQAGMLARQLGRPHEALLLLDQALALEPNLAAAHAERGLVLLGMGQPQVALDAARTAMRAEPKSPVAALTAGLALNQLGRGAEARELIERAVGEEPSNAAAHAAHRDLLFQADPPAALIAAHHATEFAPADPNQHLRLGELLLAQGDRPGAIRAFEAALALDRRQPEAYIWLSRAHAQNAAWNPARRAAEQALALAPGNAEYRALLAETYAGSGDPESAIHLLKEAITSYGERAEWLHALGLILFRNADHIGGLDYLRRATYANPQHDTAQHNLGLALAETGDLAGSAQALGRAIQLAPDKVDWRADLAEVQIARGWSAESLAEIEQGLAQAPTNSRLLRLRAEARIQIGRNDDAQADLITALRRDPDDVPALTLFTQLALNRAQPKAALGAARRAVALQPAEPQHRRQLAAVLRSLGKPDEAAEQLEQIVSESRLASDYAALAEDQAAAGNLVRARWAWERAFASAAGDPELQVRYGTFLLAQGDLAGARREIEQAAAQNPDSATILVQYADLLLLTATTVMAPHDQTTATQVARQAAALAPEQVGAWRALGAALWHTGQAEESLAALRRARSLAPHDATLSALFGVVALSFEEYQEAIAAFEHASQIDSRFAAAHAGLAIALRSPLGLPIDPDELDLRASSAVQPITRALAALDAALALEPQRPRWRYERGLVLQLAGRHAEALSDLEACSQMPVREILPTRDWADLIQYEIGRVPLASDILLRCAVGYDILGQVDQAATALDSVLAEYPELPAAIELRGLIAARRGELDLAQKLLQAVLELIPAAQRALVALGKVLIALGRAADAVGLLERASDQRPSDAGLAALLVGAYTAAGRRDRALHAAAKAARLEPRDADHHQRLATLYADAGRLQEARAELMSATTLRPTVPDWHVQMAQICLGLGMREAARGALRKAAEIAPEQPSYRYELARFLADQGEEQEARATLEEVVSAAPTQGAWRHELGRLYQHLGDTHAAINQFAAAVEHAPEEQRHWLALAKAQQPALGPDLAVETLERALNAFPGDSELHTALGSLYDAQAPATALWHYQQAVDSEPEQSEPWWRYGRALMLSGDRQAATTAIERALRIDPRAASAHAVKAQLLAASGDVQGALHHGRTAAAIGPEDPTAVAWVAAALQKARRYDEALTVLAKAIDRNPEDAELLAQSGDAAIAAGRNTQAAELFDRALKLRPNDATLYYRAGVAHKQFKNYPAAIRLLRRAIQLRPSYGDAIQELSRLGPLAFASTYMTGDRPPAPPDSAPTVDDFPTFERPDRRS